MNKHFSNKRKILPIRLSRLTDDKVEIGLNQLKFPTWHETYLKTAKLKKHETIRARRLSQRRVKANVDGILLFSPFNIRYTINKTNL
ncbi:MAG: hypothetical protein P8M50_08415 [Paracoccaceae bacterium]|nr:hypothetical protein [Paracoccaceae bacterium]